MKIKLLDLQNITLRRGKIHFDTIYVNSKHIYFIFYYIYCLLCNTWSGKKSTIDRCSLWGRS